MEDILNKCPVCGSKNWNTILYINFQKYTKF